MRMWGVDPKILCRKHLLGEHVEMHMFVGCINKRISLKGYIDNNLVEVHNIKDRHDKLVDEMKKRNMNHKSPLPKFKDWIEGKVYVKDNVINLLDRCDECLERFKNGRN